MAGGRGERSDAAGASAPRIASGPAPASAPRADRAPGRMAAVASFARETFSSRACWRSMLAVACGCLSVLLMNRALFPLFDDVFTYARDVSITCGALVAIAIGLVSLVRPRLLRGRALVAGMLSCLVAGAVAIAAGLALASPALLALGACLFVTGRGWASLSSALSAVRFPSPQAMAAIACGFALGQLVDLPARLLPQAWGVAVLFAAALLAIVLVARPSIALIDDIAAGPAVADLAVTRPTSFLPLTSNLYVCLILVQAAFGFALRFGEVEGSPAFGSLAVPFMLAVALMVVLTRGRFLGDALVDFTLLALMAGFLLVIVGGSSNVTLANGLLTVGTSIFNITLYSTLVALAARNRLAALCIVAWGQGLSGLGTTLGALLGTTANRLDAAGSHEQLALLVAVVTLALMAYALFGLRGFSLARTIEGVVPPEPAAPPALAGEELFARRAEELAARFGLTARERDVFAMLARGRNREHIEEALGVSRNTVKAHVKHVYAKLGIHSHQELIDLFEQA